MFFFPWALIFNRWASTYQLLTSCKMSFPPSSNSDLNFLFDSHNHVHMSISMIEGTSPVRTLQEQKNIDISAEYHNTLVNDAVDAFAKAIRNHFFQAYEELKTKNSSIFPIKGMALMSTQPRDFALVSQLSLSLLNLLYFHMIPCFGIHPWFLHVANIDFPIVDHFDANALPIDENPTQQHPTKRLNALREKFSWFPYLEQQLVLNPRSHVGEIGLDGARFTYTSDDTETREKILVSPMNLQVEAMEVQLHLAADLQRSVSIHVVQAWGPVMDLFQRVKKQRLEMFYGISTGRIQKNRKERLQERKLKSGQGENFVERHLIWPPKIYFHSFGGKLAVIDQLDALLGKSTTTSAGDVLPGSELYFGFAPVINYRSPKTAQVVQKVGIHRLVLETDLEEYQEVIGDLHQSVNFVAEVLNIDPQLVVEKTFANSCRLYNI